MKHVSFFDKDYPRPQFVRNNFKLLNGEWDFAFDDNNQGETNAWYSRKINDLKINVPFSYQTKLSGINKQEDHIYLWYQKEIDLFKLKDDEDQLIIFEGVDYHTKAWIDGNYLGEHFGGYSRFSFSLRDYILSHKTNKKALLTLRVDDDLIATKPRGKQSWKKEPFGCWYTPTSGIYKTVWTEKVNVSRFNYVKVTPNLLSYTFDLYFDMKDFVDGSEIIVNVTYNDNKISENSFKVHRSEFDASISIASETDGFMREYWTPEKPDVYEIEFILKNGDKVLDHVYSYSGNREFKKEKNMLLLNQNPVYLRLVLEQGYYPDGGLTAPSYEDLEKEIQLIKELGFNGMRVHQKIEDERFLYLADVYGLFVWCEDPSAYEYRDSLVYRQTNEWLEIVKNHYNHPSVIVWVPLNESWGVPHIRFDEKEQKYANGLYELTKAIDPIRPVISNDGWEHTRSDIITLHNYEQDPNKFADFYKDIEKVTNCENIVDYNQTRVAFSNGYCYRGEPIMIDEFIGTAFDSQTKDSKNHAWGYGDAVKGAEQFTKRLDGLIKVVVKNNNFAGFCITQLTDVYQEVNGLLDFDRKPKIDIEVLKGIITQK